MGVMVLHINDWQTYLVGVPCGGIPRMQVARDDRRLGLQQGLELLDWLKKNT